MISSLRWRLLLYYLLVMASILSLFGTGVYVFFSRNLYSQLEKRLRTLAQSATPAFSEVETNGNQYLNRVDKVPWRDIFNRDKQSIQWFDAQMKLLGRKGVIKLDTPPDLNTLGKLDQYELERRKISISTYTITVFTRDNSQPDAPLIINGYIRASQSIEEIKTAQNQLLLVLLVGGGITLILSGVGGFWLSQKAIEPIGESFQKLKQFTADASHELRGPLTAIKASVSVMQSHPERVHPKDVKKLAAVASATTQMGQLIEDLLFLARTDRVVAIPQRENTEVSLNQLLQNLVVLLEPFAQEKNIVLKSNINIPVKVFGDRHQLNRLFSNLLENALQYTPSGGEVSLDLSKQNRFAIVSVKDSGIGIAPEQLPLVFDRFWRADKARSRREGGTGLGLAIAQAIAQRHGGKITVSSQLDAGSCFQVRIPILKLNQPSTENNFSYNPNMAE